MAKRIGLWIGVMLCCGAVLWGSYQYVHGMQDDVTVTEHVLYGDRTLADGISIRTRTQYDLRLFWDTTYVVGSESQCETTVLQSGDKAIREMDELDQESFYITPISFAMSREYSNGMDLDEWASLDVRIAGFQEILEDVASRCKNGLSREETVLLTDYYEFYPLYCVTSGEFQNLYYVKDGAYQTTPWMGEWDVIMAEGLRDFLKIPIAEGDSLRVRVVKDVNGNITSVDTYNSTSEYGFCPFPCVTTEKGIYIVGNEYGGLYDFSQVPGGLGIYYIPFITEGDYRYVALDQMSMICSLDPAFSAMYVAANEVGDHLAVYGTVTAESESRQELFFLDTETHQIVSVRQEDGTMASQVQLHGVQNMVMQDDYIVLEQHDSRAGDKILLYQLTESPSSEEAYEMRIRAKWYTPNGTAYDDRMYHILMTQAELTYDGQYLAICDFLWASPGDSSDCCDVYLALYGAEGIVYYGVYASSLTSGFKYSPPLMSVGETEQYHCSPMAIDSMTIRWDK